MMEMQPQGRLRPHHEGEARHEASEVGARGIVIFALGLVALGAVVFFALDLVMGRFAKRESRIQASMPPLLATPVEFPGPHLQADPAAERLRVQEQQLEQLNGYGWVDRKAGIAHIPIDRAMEILARTGLPEIKEQPQPAAVPAEKPESKPSDQTKPNSQAVQGRNP